ncbi:RES family NAD+ phosphorylase [Nocardia sp. NRRL S-836]|uniref:RES family NAD+ phosphorylase n=1 Tax=Nocardia sp. NRRL S-836 TaxID=1519492 RepID=UPI0006AF45AA|nr:RES family NAD+ phosphorylase [Nocardia sp. NRRL S-836]
MIHHAPPATLTGTPTRATVPAGTVLHRVHAAAQDPAMFDKPHAGPFGGGGRFDATAACGYRTVCLSAAPETTIAERFLREFALTSGAERMLSRASLIGQVLTEVRTTRDLNLIRLYTAQDLAEVHQDSRLVVGPPEHFPFTREWATWLHDQVPWADGILWQSIADMPRDTLVLFDDRCPVPAPTGVRHVLDDDTEFPWLRDLLSPYRVRLDPPAPWPRFFINYRTGDAQEAPELLHRELSRRLGEKAVFRDVRSIRPGTPDFAAALEDNVRHCQTVLAVIGRRWEHECDDDGVPHLENPQDWVRRELVLAHESGVPVVPVLLGARLKLNAATLPPELAHLVSAQYVQLPRGFGEPDVKLLVDRLLHE